MNLTSQTEMIPRTTLISSFWRRRLKKKRRNLSNCVYKDSKDTPERKKETEIQTVKRKRRERKE